MYAIPFEWLSIVDAVFLSLEKNYGVQFRRCANCGKRLLTGDMCSWCGHDNSGEE